MLRGPTGAPHDPTLARPGPAPAPRGAAPAARPGPDAAHGPRRAGADRRRDCARRGALCTHAAGRRRHAEDPVVAGPDTAEPALRHRHQGRRRRAHLLRAAGALGRRRRAAAGAGRRDPQSGQRRRGGRRPQRGLDAQAQRHLARRHAVHGRRRAVQRRVRTRPRHRRHHARQLRRHAVRQGGQPHRARRLRQADAVLGQRLLHRLADREASPRALPRRHQPRRARQPAPGGHRPVPLRRLQAGRLAARRDQPRVPRAQPAALRRAGGQGRR